MVCLYPKEFPMTQSAHNRAAELHNLAAHAHSAAAAAHNKGDHLSAHELSKQAYELSMSAHRHAEENFVISSDFQQSDLGKSASPRPV
jgi:hypothetical protein